MNVLLKFSCLGTNPVGEALSLIPEEVQVGETWSLMKGLIINGLD